MIKASAKAISPLIATVIILGLTITVSLMVISSLTSVTKSQTTAVASRAECAGALLNILQTKCETINWWNSSWQYRQKINVTNNAGSILEQNYTANMTANFTQLILNNNMSANGNDTRIVWYNSISVQNIELDRINTTPFYSNGSLTVLWFRLQQNVSSNASDTNYYLYYGNPSAGAAPANRSNVYVFYDDLTSSSGWTITDNVFINTAAQRIEGSSTGSYNRWAYKSMSAPVRDFEATSSFIITSAGTDVTAWFVGLTNQTDVLLANAANSVYFGANKYLTTQVYQPLQQGSSVGGASSLPTQWSFNTQYFLTLRKLGTTYNVFVYLDPQRTNLVWQNSIAAPDIPFTIYYGFSNGFSYRPDIDVMSGYSIAPFKVRKYMSPEPLAAFSAEKSIIQTVVYNPSSVDLTNLSIVVEVGEKAYVNTTQLAVKSGELQFINIEVPQGEIKNLRVSAGNCPVWIERKKAGTCG